MTLLVCFAGQIGSGKSSVSSAVADALGWSRTGFGDYLRFEIGRQGAGVSSREVLQDLGQSRVGEDPVKFCRDVLAFGGFSSDTNFVIDGIRHMNIYDILVGLAAPATSRLVFLSAPQATRLMRVGRRTDSDDLARADRHPVEAEVGDMLAQRADALIDAEAPFDEVVSAIIPRIRAWA